MRDLIRIYRCGHLVRWKPNIPDFPRIRAVPDERCSEECDGLDPRNPKWAILRSPEP